MPGPEFGEAQRTLMENHAVQLYEDAVELGGLRQNDPRAEEGAAERPALDLLVDLGLLSLDPAQGRYVPADPTSVGSRVVGPMSQRAIDLLEESGRWSQVFSSLGQSYRRSSTANSPVTEIRGLPNINRFLSAIIDDAQAELLTAQPTRGRASSMDTAADRDLRAVQRGVSMRTLYQHSSRNSTAIADYVAMLAPYGVQVRTLEEFFNKMIVVDRAVAVVPSTDGNDVAIAVHDPSIVAYLCDVFERSWERARAYDDRGLTTSKTVATELRNMTVRMLVEGYSDPASAKRLGVSTRTYAGYIAALKEEYGVQTRFQLGFAMGHDLDDRRTSDAADSTETT